MLFKSEALGLGLKFWGRAEGRSFTREGRVDGLLGFGVPDSVLSVQGISGAPRSEP